MNRIDIEGRLYMTDEIPEDFVIYTEWPEFMSAEMMPSWTRARYVGSSPRGMRRGIGPLVIESYVSDKEPTIGAGPGRIVIWQRLSRSDVPQGWHTNRLISKIASGKPYREGFSLIESDESHFLRWAPTERARRRHWHKDLLNKKYRIDTVTGGEFWTAYKTSSTWKKIERFNRMTLHQLLNFYADHGTNLVCRVMRRIDTGEIVAGMSTLNSPTCRGSYYFIGFLCDSGRADHAMTGLMDDWFTYASEKGIRYVDLGHFWGKDSPHNWKGFSDFKAKFVTHYIDFPPILIRLVRRSS